MNGNVNVTIKKLDSYSMLISAKYLKSKEDFINIICVNSKFKETTEKLRYNPISIKSLKLFPKIQTQYLYNEKDKRINGIERIEIWYRVDYDQYLKYKQENIKCHNIVYSHENRLKYGNKIPDAITILGDKCFGCDNDRLVDNNTSSIKKSIYKPKFNQLVIIVSVDVVV